MGSLAGPIEPQGPFVDLKVMASQYRVALLKSAGQPYPQPVVVRALINTGAACCVIDATILARLGLSATGSVAVHTPTTGADYERKDQYDATLAIGFGGDQPLVVTAGVVEAHLASEGFLALIGWDLLRHCTLRCDGPAGTFTLDF